MCSTGCFDVKTIHWDRSATDCAGLPAPAPWPMATPAEAGLDGQALSALGDRIAGGELGNLHSLVVARDGKLVFERYFKGDDAHWDESLGTVEFSADTLHDLRSVTKSVVGALVGIAHGDGSLPDLDAPLASFFPEQAKGLEGALAGRTLRHALTMSAGLSWDEMSHPYWDPRNDENGLWRSRDPLAFALSREPVAPPGTRFAYNGGLPTVLAAAVEKASGMPLDRFAQEKLFCPLGVKQVEWIQHGSGVFVAASGLRLTPRDMARFGQLMLDDGRFGGRQIVPADYARASLAPQVSIHDSLTEGYGYLWWVAKLPPEAGGTDLPLAIGNGGQRIVVSKPARVVVVITAGAYDSPRQGEGPRTVFQGVLRAIAPGAGQVSVTGGSAMEPDAL
jgi:CubicO group peptidase (beta-lactamase class C family)